MRSRESRTCMRNLPRKQSASRLWSNWFVAGWRRKSVSLSGNARTGVNNMAIPGFGEVAERLRRSTVLVHSGGRGAGSGVIWSSDGLVVTNAHVVRGSRVNVQLWDGREFEAAIPSRDPRRDLAH